MNGEKAQVRCVVNEGQTDQLPGDRHMDSSEEEVCETFKAP